MADIKFEQAVFHKENEDEIAEVCEQFKKLISKCSADTIFQLSHFDLLARGYDLSDYVYNDDISSTTLKKLKEYVDELEKVIDDEDFVSLKETAEMVSKIMSKNLNARKG